MSSCLAAAFIAVASAVSPGLSWQQSAPLLHVLKISAGPSGVEAKGNFKLTEERTTFSRTEHPEVIVLYQWEGVPGKHKLEAKWRSPDGGTSTSVIDYMARDRRFGAYWRMPITPGMALGTWSIEAMVDGEPGGRFTFDIIDATPPPAEPVKPAKRALTQQELYERLARSYVVLVRATAAGRDLDAAGAVVGSDGQIMTAVNVLDAVGRLQGIFAGGVTQDLVQVIDVRRQAGWAILSARTDPVAVLPRAAEAPRVGDRSYSMQGTPAGARVLIEGQVTGRTESTGGGWVVNFVNGAGTAGAPVVNDYGELIGILGATATPELDRITAGGGTFQFGNIPMIPIGTITARPGAAASSFEALRARGDLLEPLVHDTDVLSGGFATRIGRGPTVSPEDQRHEFSTKEKELVVFVTWAPRERLKGQMAFKVFDAANRPVLLSKPSKVDYRKNDLVLSSLRAPMLQTPGIYRVEIHLDGKPAWRDYVRILP